VASPPHPCSVTPVFRTIQETVLIIQIKLYQAMLLLVLTTRCDSMILRKKRIVNIDPVLSSIARETNFIVGIQNPARFKEKLRRIGFTLPLQIGESILPPVSLGPVSQINAEGYDIIHRGRPKETAYRQVEWHWEEFDGPYDRTPQSRLVDVPYKRFPRTHVPPFSVELTLTKDLRDNFMIIGPYIKNTPDNKELIKHTLNLFFELFRECQIFSSNLKEIIKPPILRLNWQVLPPGRMPWETVMLHVRPIIELAPEGNRPFIWHRIEFINKYGPDFWAFGKGGFTGYFIMGFEAKNLYVCESVVHGNATYIFNEGWEELSRKTKAEILDAKLQKDRIIHRIGHWDKSIRGLLG